MNIIGVAGYARCGKDTFVKIAINILSNNGYKAYRLAFADELKNDIDPFLKEKYGVSAWTSNPLEKDLIRPLLVAHGCGKRNQGDGKYWIEKINNKIQNILSIQEKDSYQDYWDFVLISDCRFCNELEFIQKDWNGEIIHLKRYKNEWQKGGQDGSDEYLVKVYDPPPNEEERKNDPLVQNAANYKVEWENAKKTTPDEATEDPSLQNVVLDALNNTKYFRVPATGKLSL